MATHSLKIWPYKALVQAYIGAADVMSRLGLGRDIVLYHPTEQQHRVPVSIPELVQPGLTKLVMVDKDQQLAVKVIDLQGKILHQWHINWYELWPTPQHLAPDEIPNTTPGTHVHGALILKNGDLIFNFEHLGLMRINGCGKPVWRLPYRTHHSIDRDSQGNFWVPGQINHYERDPDQPSMKTPFIEATVIEVSPEGQILREFSVFEVLRNNGLTGLLHMNSIDSFDASSTEDVVHLNDVEIFKTDMPAGVFSPGDIMLSLRNINTIIVLEPVNLKAKYVSVGKYVRQHDPDFLDGNRISVYDNNNLGRQRDGYHSRIVIENALTGEHHIRYSGTEDQPFYSRIMGKQQRLANGNLLVAESMRGRAFEVSPKGKIVWDFYNLVGDDLTDTTLTGTIEGVERLPDNFDKQFFTRLKQQCRQ